MDISSISAYTNYITSQTSSTQASSLQETLSSVSSGTTLSKEDDEKLLDACKQFEAYLLEQVFKEMEKSVDALNSDEDEDNSTSNLVDYFMDETIQQICSDSTETQGLGLAQTLYEQMKRNYGLVSEEDAEASETTETVES